MKNTWYLIVSLIVLLISANSSANLDFYSFPTPKLEERYQHLIKELRCLVCQNQNLEDSNADLAKDLRKKTYEMLIAGRSDSEIIDFMIARYGNFVTYRPPFSRTTFILWFAPALLMFVGVIVLWRVALHSKLARTTIDTKKNSKTE